MRLSTALQYWALFVIIPQFSLAAPVKRPHSQTPSPEPSHHDQSSSQVTAGGSQTYQHGQIIFAAPNNFVGVSTQGMSRNEKKAGNGRHPAIVTDGPHTGDKYTVAGVTHNPDPHKDGRPTIDAAHIVPHGHTLEGWIGLKPQHVAEPHMRPAINHPQGLPKEHLDTLKSHMQSYENWKPGDHVDPKHKNTGPPTKSSATHSASSHHQAQNPNHAHQQSSSHHAPPPHPQSQSGGHDHSNKKQKTR